MNTAQQLKSYLMQLSSSQAERAQEAYQHALAKLNQAESSPAEREGLLKSAARDLLQAIQKNRHSADPYAGMAYVQFLRQEPDQSLRFLPQHSAWILTTQWLWLCKSALCLQRLRQ